MSTLNGEKIDVVVRGIGKSGVLSLNDIGLRYANKLRNNLKKG